MSTLAVGTIKSISSAAPVFQNTSGTEKGQLCKAWIVFDGKTVTSSTNMDGVLDSFNISSITDSGVGKYTINFANQMANANYAVVACNGRTITTNAENPFILCVNQHTTDGLKSTAGFRIDSLGGGSYLGLVDAQDASIAVFGD